MSSSLSAATSRWAAGILAFGVCVLAVLGLTLLVERQSLIGDSIGYLYAAQRIAAGFGPSYDDPNNVWAGQYFSLYAFQIKRPDTHLMYLGFAPGLPFLLSAPLLLDAQSEFVYMMVPLLALVCLALSGLLAWMLTRALWAVFWAMLLLAVTPALWFFGTSMWSEIPSAAAIAGALALYLYVEQRSARRWVELSAVTLCGVLLACGVFIRYSNMVLIPVCLLADALLIRKQPDKLKLHWPLWVLSGMTVVAVLVFNAVYYGAWNLTSYSPAHGWYPWPAFSLDYAFGRSFVGGHSLVTGLETLWRNFGLFLLLAPIGWIRLRRAGAILAGSSLAIFSVYAIYAFAPTGLNARFLIPMFPMVAVGAGAATVAILGWLAGFPRVLLAIGLFLLALRPLPEGIQETIQRNQGNSAQVALIQTLTADTPANAVFMSYPWNDLIAVYGDRSVFNYRRVPVSDPVQQRFHNKEALPVIVTVVSTLLEHGRPVYYVGAGNSYLPDLLETLLANFSSEAQTTNGVTMYKLSLSSTP